MTLISFFSKEKSKTVHVEKITNSSLALYDINVSASRTSKSSFHSGVLSVINYEKK